MSEPVLKRPRLVSVGVDSDEEGSSPDESPKHPTKNLLLGHMDDSSDDEDEDSIDEDDIPDDFHGDPDEYRAMKRAEREAAENAGGLVAQAEDEDEDDSIPQRKSVVPVQRGNDVFPFKEDSSSQFSKISKSVLHEILMCLDIVDLLRVSTLNRAWSQQLEDDTYWSWRYIQDIGEDRYREEVIGSRTCAWSPKHHLLWSLVNIVGRGQSVHQRFATNLETWACIMRERQRRFLEEKQKQNKSNNPPDPSVNGAIS